ncbi:hypothetical protein H5410_027586 [Solanum commersonii]|uniref:Uncharacterized protein n=1 Tax=Solanum commersonii TaxID=4109 RepID=A0A9J5Z4W1_SOLCO|nr:hypothetical protein H5410_027586 [Solanum commersonii]
MGIDCSPREEVHHTSCPSKMAGQITGDKNSGEQAVEGDNGTTRGNGSLGGEVHLNNISTNLA